MDSGEQKLDITQQRGSALEVTIEQLVEHAERVLETQRRLERLLEANRAIVEHLDLPQVLRRVVEAAVSLVGAKYGALGVLGGDGRLEEFIPVGMSPEAASAIGESPTGLLGAVIDAGATIRLEDVAGDDRASGFWPHHPEPTSFLGVPIRVRDQVFGNLYLADRAGGPFTAEDEEMVAALAATAGVAIDNARLYDETRRREKWNRALAAISSVLIAHGGDALDVIFERVADLVEVDEVCLMLRDGDRVRVAAARGTRTPGYVGLSYQAEGSLIVAALEAGEPVSLDSMPAGRLAEWTPDVGPTIVVPLPLSTGEVGGLSVSRHPGRPRFAESDIRMAADFAAQVGVAMELARARQDRARLDLVEDRSRIARDLHDHVIQRLFGTGLSLQSLASAAPEALRARLLEQVDTIDDAIAQIRTAVFTLQSRPSATGSLRHRVLDVVGEVTPSLPAAPHLAFSGAVDALTDDELTADVVAVLREALTNVVKHADARECDVRITADEMLTIIVEDDGRGLPDRPPRSSGLANLRERAVARGGRFSAGRRDPRGSRIDWTVPLPAPSSSTEAS